MGIYNRKVKFFLLKIYHTLYKITILLIEIYTRINFRKKKENSDIRNIVIFAYTGLGNYILMTPAIERLRQEYPNAFITLRYGSGTGCENVTTKSSLIDEYIEIKKSSNPIKNILFAIKRRKHYDVIISDFHNKGIPIAIEIAMLSAPIRIGHTSGGGWSSDFDFLYNKKVKIKENSHEIEMYNDLVDELFSEKSKVKFKFDTSVYLDSSIKTKPCDITGNNRFNIGFQVGSSSTQQWKQWPLEYFSELAYLLKNENNIIFFGSKGERTLIERVIGDQNREFLFNLGGKTNLLESFSLIAQLDLMITNDSGLMHVANALNVPLIAIYGPTDYKRTSPLSVSSNVIRSDYDCMPCFKMAGGFLVENCPYKYRCLTSISPDIVYDKVQEILAETRFPKSKKH